MSTAADVATATPLDLFRIYEPHELGRDGYPHVWHRLDDVPAVLADAVDRVVEAGTAPGVKDVVRGQAGERCLRCRHPYRTGESSVWAAPPRVEAANAKSAERNARPDAEGYEMLSGMPLPESTGELPPDLALEARKRNGLEVLYSACDVECVHGGPARWRVSEHTPWRPFDGEFDVSPMTSRGFEVQAEFRILTVHHLNGRKHDLRWWNLASLCQRCHLVIQRKVQMERVYPFEHSRWFQPFAAGWYAQAYLGEDVTREQAVERLPELLALERMA